MNDLLKFITCGSVDDGKSTLIGHMLYDAKLLFTDQKKALELDSKVGSNDGKIDYSLLLDGLMAEREQGITIDVAYRYFSTEKRSFIVADTPGHEEYTRNMAVGASFADLSIILVDAGKGVLVQTRRHTRICNMMGISHFVFAINKMDLVNYDESVFNSIKDDIKSLMSEFDYQSLTVIPVSATEGDNITQLSNSMPWYKGQTLLSYIEDVDASPINDNNGFVMPVQRVCRPNREFRGFQGQISAGEVSVGDEVTVYPSKESAKVKLIYQNDVSVQKSSKGHSVTLQLDTEIDVSRGSVIEKDYDLFYNSTFEATVLWMDDTELSIGKNYWLKTSTQLIPATVSAIKYKIDVNTAERIKTDKITKNEIARCEISVDKKIVFDKFRRNRDLGSLILIDRITNMTSGCGVIKSSVNRENNLFWQNTNITKELRETRLNQKAVTIWFTGLSGSGKSSVADALEKRLFAMGKQTMLLDGDNVRLGLNSDLGFGKADRIENIRRIAEVSKLMNDAGLIVLTSFISPFRSDRRNANDIIGDGYFEVYVNTPLEVCEKRDVKGLYKKARNGEIEKFTGINSPYESPENPSVVINTANATVEQCVDKILEKLKGIM